MAIASGLVSQLVLAEETTPGTRVVPTRAFEFVSESLKFDAENISSKALRAGRALGPIRRVRSTQSVSGDVTYELAPQGFGVLLKHMIGPNATTGAGPYTHTFAGGGNLDNVTFTIQKGIPSVDGTIRTLDFLGMSITSWTLTAEVGAFVMLTTSFYGMDAVTGQTLATATYPSSITPFTFRNAYLSVAGAEYPVKRFSLTGDNALKTGRYFMRSTNPGVPASAIQGDRRNYTGTLLADFQDLTQYGRFVSAAESALVLNFVSGANTLTITCNVIYDGTTPSVGGPDLLEQESPFTILSSTSDAAAMTAVLVNSDSTP